MLSVLNSAICSRALGELSIFWRSSPVRTACKVSKTQEEDYLTQTRCPYKKTSPIALTFNVIQQAIDDIWLGRKEVDSIQAAIAVSFLLDVEHIFNYA